MVKPIPPLRTAAVTRVIVMPARVFVEQLPPGRVEPSGAEQEVERNVAIGGLNQPVAVKVVIQPRTNTRDVGEINEVGLVQHHHIGARNLPELQLLVFRDSEHLAGVDADDAVDPKPHAVHGVQEGHGNAGRVGHAAGLQHDMLRVTCCQIDSRRHQSTAWGIDRVGGRGEP